MNNTMYCRIYYVILFLMVLDFTGGFLTNKTLMDSKNGKVMGSGCAKEISQHCVDVEDNMLISCLYTNRDLLSEECAIVVEETFIGACDPYARQFCSEFTNVNDIAACLDSNSQTISTQCKFNLENKDDASSVASLIKDKYYQRLTLMVTLCSFYLIICVIASIWAFYKVYMLYKRQVEVMSTALSNSLAEQTMTDHQPPIRLDLLDVSYQINSSSREVVFSNVSFSVEPGQATLILGSSAGRWQLLLLLSGDLRNGKLSGVLAVDDQAASIATFNKVLRGHRVVCPSDALGLPRLTAWQVVLHAVLLRTPEHTSLETAVLRARNALLEVELLSDAHSLVMPAAAAVVHPLLCAGCGIQGRQQTACLSVLQTRCLLIALALLDAPQLLLLDQMLSELSAKESQDIWRILKSVRRTRHIGIVLAEDSCSANVLEEVDTVVLLSEAGQMVCSGDRRSIEELVSNEGGSIEVLCTSVTSAAQGSSGGLLDEESADQEAPLLSEQGGVEMRRLLTTYTDTHYRGETIQPTAAVLQDRVRRKYLQSTAYQTLRDCIIFPDTNGNGNTMQNSASLSVDSAAVSADTERNLPAEDSTRSISMQSSAPVLLLYTKRGYALAPLSQVWVLVSQAVWSQQRRGGALLVWITAVVIGTVSIAFACHSSNSTEGSIDAPQRTAWALGAVVVHVFILEAQFLKSTSSSSGAGCSVVDTGRVSEWARVLSTVLTDTSRALLICALVLSVLYSTYPLNPNQMNVAFGYVSFVVGMCAWQAFVRFVIALLEGHPLRSSTTVIVVVLVVGVLLSGLVPLQHASSLVVLSMRVAVLPALVIRALVVNDLYCCYMTTTCNALLLLQQTGSTEPTTTTVQCADALAFTGDGWDAGNLGRFYLQENGLGGERPVFLLFLLVITGIIWRVSAVYLALQRQRRRKQQQQQFSSKNITKRN